MDVVYGGVTGPAVGWNHVVVAPGAVVNTPGGVISSLSQTWNVPLMAGYWAGAGQYVGGAWDGTYISKGVVVAASVQRWVVGKRNGTIKPMRTHISS